MTANCEIISRFISNIKNKLNQIDLDNLDIKNIGENVRLKKEIEQGIVEFFEKYSGYNEFFADLEDKEKWKEVIVKLEELKDKKAWERNDNIWDIDIFSEVWTPVFGSTVKGNIGLTSKKALEGLERITGEEISKRIREYIEEVKTIKNDRNLTRFYPDFFAHIQRDITSIFVNNFSKNIRLVLDQSLPNQLEDDFCQFLSGNVEIEGKVGNRACSGMINGRFVAKEAGTRFGYYMRGGFARVDKTEGGLGHGMRGGTIIIGEDLDYSGSHMSGGTIFVDKTGSHLGDNAFGGVLIANSAGKDMGYTSTKALILVNNTQGIYEDAKANIYTYDESLKEYVGYNEKKVIYDFNMDSGESFPENILIVSSDESLYSSFAMEDIENNIVVLRHLPKELVGKGMKSGAIIFEVPGLGPLEAKKYISSEKRGGVILMRVEDPEDPKKTKLIEVG